MRDLRDISSVNVTPFVSSTRTVSSLDELDVYVVELTELADSVFTHAFRCPFHTSDRSRTLCYWSDEVPVFYCQANSKYDCESSSGEYVRRLEHLYSIRFHRSISVKSPSLSGLRSIRRWIPVTAHEGAVRGREEGGASYIHSHSTSLGCRSVPADGERALLLGDSGIVDLCVNGGVELHSRGSETYLRRVLPWQAADDITLESGEWRAFCMGWDGWRNVDPCPVHVIDMDGKHATRTDWLRLVQYAEMLHDRGAAVEVSRSGRGFHALVRSDSRLDTLVATDLGTASIEVFRAGDGRFVAITEDWIDAAEEDEIPCVNL